MTDLVLLVEDELLIALDLQGTIEDAGFRVEGPCTTLSEAQEAIDRHGARFAAALLDVRLADDTVFPAADRLHAAGVPLLFHSGHADDADLRRRYPLAMVCPKPSAPDTLSAALLRCVQMTRVG
ncbi:response regulator [Sphingomonas endophytica]|uniref:Histidine kinase n=1 Tax=Sphingomonas endophytica TaxID=869719 RepID=A0A147I9P7_9SPHN|nr:response regulator [Sphingomonas endophytica]KTT76366.1 histidine kinase [Sphingomonas endophytica]